MTRYFPAISSRGMLVIPLLPGNLRGEIFTGTHESLLQAANFIEAIELRQGLKVACVEEIAYRMGYIDAEQLERLARPLNNSGYGRYLLEVLEESRGVS